MGLIITLCLGGFIIIGALISYLTRNNHTIVLSSISLALGTLSMLAVLELLPEAVEHLGLKNLPLIAVGALLGLLSLRALDHFLPDHDHTENSDHTHAHYVHNHAHGHDHSAHKTAHIGVISAIAVTLHNVIEGMAVYSIAEQSVAAGLMIALGVGLHNIPMGMVISATLQGNKRERRWMLLLSSLSTFFGGLLMSVMWDRIGEKTVGFLISITLGMILYIICFELLPTVRREKQWKLSIPCILIGALLIVISTMLE